MSRLIVGFLIMGMMLLPNVVEAKKADLAGKWYSALEGVLDTELDTYLSEADVGTIDGKVVGVIAPHAGYRASGFVAGYAYKVVQRVQPKKVIVVGFSHRRYYPEKVAVLADIGFTTPFGRARIDQNITKKLIEYSGRIMDMPQVFVEENSIEMQVPFIQKVCPDAEIVLVMLCDQRSANCDFLVDALYDVLQGEEDYIIIGSADMSHYLSYYEVKARDTNTISVIEELDSEVFYRQCMKQKRPDNLFCGYGAVYTTMKLSKRLGANEVEVLKYGSSGDSIGDKRKVVGYLSAAFVENVQAKQDVGADTDKGDDEMLNQTQRDELLKIARSTIDHYLETGESLEVVTDDEELKQDMGAFVTLHKNGQLRGCIGNMVARGPLYLAVRDMAIAAAVEDPRFPNVTPKEMEQIDIEISALSPMRKTNDYNEIVAGKHGVLVRQGGRSGVYLPQVATETGWDRDEFMTSLCAQKAGIPANAWRDGSCEIYLFTAEVFGEKEE